MVRFITLIALTASIFLSASLVHAELVVVVHPQNTISTLSQREVSQLFLGRIRMFPSTKIKADTVDQNESSSAYAEFYGKLVKLSAIKVGRYRAAYIFSGRGTIPTQLDDANEVKKYVSGNVSGIGYIDAAMVDNTVKVVYRLP